MSCTLDFIEYVMDQISNVGSVSYKRMFGEAMVYINDLPIFLVCDNTVYVKIIEELKEVLKDASLGIPYPGGKDHFILDIDNKELAEEVADISLTYRISHVKKNKKK